MKSGDIDKMFLDFRKQGMLINSINLNPDDYEELQEDFCNCTSESLRGRYTGYYRHVGSVMCPYGMVIIKHEGWEKTESGWVYKLSLPDKILYIKDIYIEHLIEKQGDKKNENSNS